MSNVIAQTKAQLFTFPDGGQKDHKVVDVFVERVSGFDYSFTLKRQDKVLFSQIIEDEMAISFSKDSLEWVVHRPDANLLRMRIQFKEGDESYRPVLLAIARALIESSTSASIEELYEEEDRNWAISSQLPDMNDKQDDEQYYEISEPTPLFPKKDEKDTIPVMRDFSSGRKTSIMAPGFKNNRTYFAHGDIIEVFKHDNDGNLNKEGIAPLINAKLKNVKKLQLHKSDTQLLLLDSETSDRIFNMDIETGRVIEEWHGVQGHEIRNLAPRSKYAQVTDENLVVGVSDSGVFSIDPRINEQNKVAEEMFYKTRVDFTSLAATGEGNVAIASKSGDIRLCNRIQKNFCKTLLPGIGASLKHIEVTEDGSWLVATADKCLILFDLTILGGKLDSKSGFTNRMGQFKPRPYVLKISPQDMLQYKIDKVNFTPARFNTGTLANSREEFISTSTGKCVVTWDFTKVKKGILSAYSIKTTGGEQAVVEDRFRHNFQKELLIAKPDTIFSSKFSQRKKQL